MRRLLILIAIVLLTAFALQAGLLVFAMYVLIGVLLLSRYLAKRWVEGLSAKRECETEPVEIGATVPIKVRLTNRGTIQQTGTGRAIDSSGGTLTPRNYSFINEAGATLRSTPNYTLRITTAGTRNTILIRNDRLIQAEVYVSFVPEQVV